MNGGLLAIGVGVWVLCQIFGGQLLARTGIYGSPTLPSPPKKGG